MTKGEKTKNKILDVSMTLFLEKGYEETTVSDICKEANIAVGTFYHYFTNKKLLLLQELEDFDSFYLSLNEMYLSMNPFEFIQLLFDKTMEKLMELDKEYIRLIYSNFLDNESDIFTDHHRTLYQIVHERFEQAIEQNLMPSEYDSWEMTDRIIMIVHGTIYYWLSKKSDKTISDLVKIEVNFLLKLLK